MQTAATGGPQGPKQHHCAETDGYPGPDGDQGPYYRIGELAREFKLSLRTLRFYEDKDLLHPVRVGSSRLFTRRDRARLVLILMGRKVGFSLREVKHMLDLYRADETNTRQYEYVLEKSAAQLKRLKKQRDEVTDAIDTLQGAMMDIRRQLADEQRG